MAKAIKDEGEADRIEGNKADPNEQTIGQGDVATLAKVGKVATPVTRGGGHKATYAADKRKGGWLVRVEGPRPDSFVGRIVPVTRRDDTVGDEALERVVWSGKDEDTGKPVCLYKFAPKPQSLDEIPF
jgi:hypothetical protein